MKKKWLVLLPAFALVLSLAGCGEKPLLSPKDPVTLSMWHVYGEQAGSPMDLLVDEFNETVGQEQGIVINVTNLSGAGKIGAALLAAQSDEPGALEMPDLFTCHIGDALALGAENLLDWNDCFSADERAGFVDGFLADGTENGQLLVLPISKSTHVLMLNGSQFACFSADTGVTLDDLATWDGFFTAAAKYYDWSDGTPFCAMDYLLRAVELNALARGGTDLYTAEGWYDFDNAALRTSWMEFARALVQDHIVVSDLYSNTQVMAGEVLGGIGSSAAILYYNNLVTYPDNSTEPMDLQVVPMPRAADGTALMTQAGVGLCAYKTDEKKAEAASVFAHWLTESQRNLDFVAETGYMPVRKDAFDTLDGYAFAEQSYRNLYDALAVMQESYTPVSEPRFVGYYAKVNALYSALREAQASYPNRLALGESVDALAEETWELFRSIA